MASIFADASATIDWVWVSPASFDGSLEALLLAPSMKSSNIFFVAPIAGVETALTNNWPQGILYKSFLFTS